MRPEPSNSDEALNENNFHEIVNDDADMYEQIDAIPADDDNIGQRRCDDYAKLHIRSLVPPESQPVSMD